LDNANALPTYPQQRQKQQEALFNSFLDGTKSAIEMAAVANALRA
jgi:predicted homoserine dehydrogenase-like protein